jgi:hypothetical protein
MVYGRSEIYYALLTGVPVKFSSQFWLGDDEKELWGGRGAGVSSEVGKRAK